MTEERKYTLEFTDLESQWLILALVAEEFKARRRVYDGNKEAQGAVDICEDLRKRIGDRRVAKED